MSARARSAIPEPSAPLAAPLTPLVLADFLPFRMALTAQAVSHLIAATCEDRFGLTIPAWRVLCLLAEAGATNAVETSGLDPRDLAFRAALSDDQVREAAAVLIGRALLRREQGSGNLLVTDQGKAAHAELADLALAAEAALLSGLAPDEVRALHRLLGRLQSAALKLSGRANT